MPTALIREQQILNFNSDVISATLTGFTSGAGTVSSSDTLVGAFQKLDGNIANRALTSTTVAGFPLSSNVVLANLTVGTGLSGSNYNGSTTQTLSVDQTFAPTWTGIHRFQNNSLTSSSAGLLYLENDTVTTSGSTVAFSPALVFRGHSWQTTVDSYNDMLMYNETDTYGSYLTVAYALNGGAATKIFQVSQYGDFGAFGTSSAGSIQMSKTTMTTSSSDGIILTSEANVATSGTPVRWSPAQRFTSMVWNTSGTPASNKLEFRMENRPISSSAPTGNLYWSYRLSPTGTGSYTDIMKLDNAGNLSVNHLVGFTSAPTGAAGTGAGTSPTITVSGNDIAIKISVAVGTGTPAASATLVTVTFNKAYLVAPKVILTPANAAAAALSGANEVFVDDATIGTGSFILKTGTTGLTVSTTYLWYAIVVQ